MKTIIASLAVVAALHAAQAVAQPVGTLGWLWETRDRLVPEAPKPKPGCWADTACKKQK